MPLPFHPEGLNGYDRWKLATPPEYENGERPDPLKAPICISCPQPAYAYGKCLCCLHGIPPSDR